MLGLFIYVNKLRVIQAWELYTVGKRMETELRPTFKQLRRASEEGKHI